MVTCNDESLSLHIPITKERVLNCVDDGTACSVATGSALLSRDFLTIAVVVAVVAVVAVVVIV